MAGCFEDVNELSDSIKCRVFLSCLKKCQLLRRNCAESNFCVSVMSTGLLISKLNDIFKMAYR